MCLIVLEAYCRSSDFIIKPPSEQSKRLSRRDVAMALKEVKLSPLHYTKLSSIFVLLINLLDMINLFRVGSTFKETNL